MTVLVTGAGSYVAKAIIRQLLEKKLEVLATYRTNRPVDLRGVKLLQLDLCNESGFCNLPRRIDSIVHVAAVTSSRTAREMVEFAHLGLLFLHRYALNSGARVLVFTSSISVHGLIDSSLLDENTPFVQPEIYGASKLTVERTLAVTADQLPVIALRLPSVLGSLESKAWVPSLMRRLLANEDVTIFNPESAFNNAIDVDELSRFIAYLVPKQVSGFHAFPIASSGSMTVTEVVDLLRNGAQSKSKVSIHKTSRRSFTISSEYAVRQLKYEPISIHETMDRFVQRVGKSSLGRIF